MIVSPIDWNVKYESFIKDNEDPVSFSVIRIIDQLLEVLERNQVTDLAYSGGIDSTVMLALMHDCFHKEDITVHTIASRIDHPDVIHSIIGAQHFEVNQNLYIINDHDKSGNNAVVKLFKKVNTERIICCDGIDEFMCGYYDHLTDHEQKYKYHLERLTPDHLIPLDKNSGEVRVYLPYLDSELIEIYSWIPLYQKVDNNKRKEVIYEIARRYDVPEEIIKRNKYGFCDALLMKDK